MNVNNICVNASQKNRPVQINAIPKTHWKSFKIIF